MVRAPVCGTRRFTIYPVVIPTKPAVSQHLAVLENAGLVASEKRGQFVFYRLVPDNLLNTLNSYAQEVCPVSRPLKAESAKIAAKKVSDVGKRNGPESDPN